MKRLPQLIVASQMVLLATPAFANPIALEILRAREVEGSHVQLTYGVDGKTPQTPSNTVTFGTKATTWKPLAINYDTNTGSGIKGVQAVQMCDCSVSVGQSLSYNVTVASAYDGKVVTLKSTLTTSGKYDAAVKDPASIDAGSMPWTIPDPVEVQGLDCAVECSAGVPSGTGGALGAGGAPGTGGEPGTGGAGGALGTGGSTGPATTEPKNNDGSCSMVQGGEPAGLVVLVLGVGLAFLTRRKRGS